MNEKSITIEEKLLQYEEFLDNLLNRGPLIPGVISAGPDTDNRYTVDVNGKPFIVKASPRVNKKDLNKNVRVITLSGQIVEILPEVLDTSYEQVEEFKRVTWDQVRGLKSQVERIKEMIEHPVEYKDIYTEFKMPVSSGVLLHGPTGVGKTLIAKAIASSIFGRKKISNKAFVYMKGGEMLSPYVGKAENDIKRTFESCRKFFIETGQRPILFIDEAEAIMPIRGSRTSSDVDKTIVPTFLAEMDGFYDNNPFIIMATNHVSQIDSAIKRPGRIDLIIEVTRPNFEDAADIFDYYLSETKICLKSDKLAEEAADMLFKSSLWKVVSGALISNLVSMAIKVAINRVIKGSDKRFVCIDDIRQAITDYNHY